jgi:outer membrane protein assembly factor BamB
MSTGNAICCFALIFWIGVNHTSPLMAGEPKPDDKATTKAPISIRLQQASEKTAKSTFVITGLLENDLQELARANWTQEQWTAIFSVRVDNAQMKEKLPPPVLGSYRIESKELIFEPRFPLAAGVRFRAVFEPARLPGSNQGQTKTVIAYYTIPKAHSTPTTKVDRVYPTHDVLPENLLKFYIHFSAPMSKGEAYQRIHLIDEGGKEVDLPFLRLEEELWNRNQTRFTLFFDPGRIKRGLRPREEVGPALEEGKSYTLVIDRDWVDAEGNPLKESFRKSFKCGPPDDDPVDPKNWKLQTPTASSHTPLHVIFPKPLDHALLERVIGVTDSTGRELEGAVSVTQKETHWSFTPKQAWQAGLHHLTVDTALEDLAGNSIGRPFEIDVFHPIQRQVSSETARIPFMVGKADHFSEAALANWHHWRGPLANGTAPEADPPVQWDEKTNIRWKVPLPGRGSASPIVWGDRVFVLTAVKTDRVATAEELPEPDPGFEKKTKPPTNFYQFLVLCFDRATGKIRWQRTAAERVPHEGHHPTHSYAAGSPTTDGRFLYVSFGSFGIYCYDMEGTPIWQRDLGRLNTRLGWGEAVTPVVHGESLLLNWDQEADSALYCLDAKTGKTKWKADRNEKTSWNTPLVIEQDGRTPSPFPSSPRGGGQGEGGRTQVIVNGTERIRSHDLATGKVLWECGGMTVNPIPSPVTSHGVVYCMSGYKGSAAFAISLDAAGDITDTARVLWRYNKGTPYVPSPLLVGDRLYFTEANSALLTVLDTKTGTAILDRERLPNQTSFYSSPVAASGRIYLIDQQGMTLVLKQSDKLEILGRNQLDDHFDATPALVGRQILLRGEKFLYCIQNSSMP